jgi:hypothetical protein
VSGNGFDLYIPYILCDLVLWPFHLKTIGVIYSWRPNILWSVKGELVLEGKNDLIFKLKPLWPSPLTQLTPKSRGIIILTSPIILWSLKDLNELLLNVTQKVTDRRTGQKQYWCICLEISRNS